MDRWELGPLHPTDMDSQEDTHRTVDLEDLEDLAICGNKGTHRLLIPHGVTDHLLAHHHPVQCMPNVVVHQ